MIAGPGPWAWDAGLVLLSTPLWILPAAAGAVLLLVARFRPPRPTASWADWLGRCPARPAPVPPARKGLRRLRP